MSNNNKKIVSSPELATLSYTTPERLVQDFACRGIVILSPDSLDIPLETHERIYQQEKQAMNDRKPITPSSIPDVLTVINSPGLVRACDQLVGKNWAIVPFTHNASFTSGSNDQHWHKDDNGPYNSRKQRHHQSIQIEMLYYPQAVREDMGPTATIPYSHYWTFNHEEDHDNFAGADHLDFNYQLSRMEAQPVSGPNSKYEIEDIVNRRTEHDIRMKSAVTDLNWPLVDSLEAAPLRAGSIVLYSHNTFHRGNHRRDDWKTWKDNPRFMWRFWLYRTNEPPIRIRESNENPVPAVDWPSLGIDPLTGVDLSSVDDDLTAVWNYHYHWIHTGQGQPPTNGTAGEDEVERKKKVDLLANQITKKGNSAEPARIGAAYRLANMDDTNLAIEALGQALYNERESVRRAATYGLAAAGPSSTEFLLAAARSQIKWVRKASIYALGDASHLNESVLEVIINCLENDPSVYVRSVAAGALGCLGRRATGTNDGQSLIPQCLEALIQSLEREENRLAMDRAQQRSIKFVRPTDDCDVCEGNGIDFGRDRFKPVRSAVRENVLWSMVILCSHGAEVIENILEPTIKTLKTVIETDENVICVGFAMDALARLAYIQSTSENIPMVNQLKKDLVNILKSSPIHSWEALVRSGLSREALAEFAAKA